MSDKGTEPSFDAERLAEIFEAVKVLPLRPSDVVVLRTPERLSYEEAFDLRGALEEALGVPRILILTGGADMDIVRQEAEPDSAKAEPARLDAVGRHMARRLSGD